MTTPQINVIWSSTLDSGTWRLVDLGPGQPIRFALQQQQGPNVTGDHWWADVGLPFADVLEAAFSALYVAATAPSR